MITESNSGNFQQISSTITILCISGIIRDRSLGDKFCCHKKTCKKCVFVYRVLIRFQYAEFLFSTIALK